jgi:hypothetical protein
LDLEGEFSNELGGIILKSLNGDFSGVVNGKDASSDLCVSLNLESVDFSIDQNDEVLTLDLEGFVEVNVQGVEFGFHEDGKSVSLVSDDLEVPGVESFEFNLDVLLMLFPVFGNLEVEVESEAVNEDVEIVLPFSSFIFEFDFVDEGDISDLDFVVFEDGSEFSLVSGSPVEVEVIDLGGMFGDDSGLGGSEDVEVVNFDLLNGDFSLDNDLVLVLEEEFSVDTVNLGLDLDLVGFDLDCGISSEHFDGSVDTGVDFDSDGDDLLFSFSSQSNGHGIDVGMYLFGD